VNIAVTHGLGLHWLATVLAFGLTLFIGLEPALAGNKELLDNWAKNKQQIKQKVFEQLQKEGKVPKNGTVYFEARTKPDPANKSNVLVEVDTIRVEESGEATTWKQKQTAGDEPGYVRKGAIETPVTKPGAAGKPQTGLSVPVPIKPVDITGYVRYGTLDIPVGEVVQDALRIRDGKIAPDTPAPGKKKPSSGSDVVP